MAIETVLPQGAGYGIVVGIGGFFTCLMLFLAWCQTRYTNFHLSSADEFNSASRSVKPGLIACGIVSAWTWAATLLQSSTICFEYGISGPYWYAAGATVQVLLMAQNAVKLKQNAPNANTFLQVIYARWGAPMHLLGMFYAFATNFFVSSMLVVGASSTVHALTGMSTIAACFLIPATVCAYVVVGGMRATLLCDYSHTCIIYAFILYFLFEVYAVSDKIGSPKAMYKLLSEAAAASPVVHNAQGSYLTMRSTGGLVFGIINITGNFATIFLDQAYWQRAIASQPQSAVRGFIVGGLSWFAIPMGFATAAGLTAVALQRDPSFATYPDLLSPAQISAGLAAPEGIAALLGKKGATILLVLLFLAVTSASSAEMIATSSLLTYDVYGTYINKNASEKQIMRVSHMGICAWALFMAVWGVIWYEIGIGLGWLFEFMGVLIAAGVFPCALACRMTNANKTACMIGGIVALPCAVACWLGVAGAQNNGVITVATTGQDYPMLTGNCVGLGVSGIISLVGSWIWPQPYAWHETRLINSKPRAGHVGAPIEEQLKEEAEEESWEKKGEDVHNRVVHVHADGGNGEHIYDIAYDDLQKNFVIAVWSSVILCLVLVILVPFPMFGSKYVLSETSFTAWVSIFIAWLMIAGVIIVFTPIIESRHALGTIIKGLYLDATRQGHKRKLPDNTPTV